MFLATNHTNISLFEEFGFAIIYDPGWSIYIVLGFVSINIFTDKIVFDLERKLDGRFN